MQVNPLIDFIIALRVALGPWAVPPLSAVLVFFISMIMALVTNLVNRRFIDYDRLRRSREEIRKWQTMQREAMKETDPRLKRKLQLKVKRRERYITKLQGDVGKMSMMPMVVTIIPFILVFTIMNGIFLNDTLVPGAVVYAPVIISPLNFGQLLGGFGFNFGYHYGMYPGIPPGAQGLVYIWWYMICSFFANLVFQRVFRTSMV